MPLISDSHLTTVLDKLARYAGEAVGDPELNASFTAGLEAAASNVLSGAGSLETFIAGMANSEAMADLLPPARDLDENHPTAADGYVLGLTGVAAMIAGINNHLKRYGGTGITNLDTYLTSKNVSAGVLRVHSNFRKYLKTVSAQNTFIPNDLPLARVNVTGATSGTYTHLASISNSAYGPAKLVAKNVGALTATTALSITGKKPDNTTQTLTVSISTLTNNAETDLSVVTKSFVDVTNITVTSGGTSGNVIQIVAKTDRDVSAA